MQNLIERAIWGNQARRKKRLADPVADVMCVVILTVVLLLAGYMHLSIGL
jgi:hypothetical protein